MTVFLMAVQMAPENGNLIPEPQLADYFQGKRAPGIMGIPEEVQDLEGNPASL